MAVTPQRVIKDMTVYCITAVFSLFAYAWLYFVLQIVSPDRVDLWEGIVTFLLFPALVYLAYLADIGTFEKDDVKRSEIQKVNFSYEGLTEEDIKEYADGLRKKLGKDLPDDKVMKLLNAELAPRRTRAGYRSGAVKGLTGGGHQAGTATADKKYEKNIASP